MVTNFRDFEKEGKFGPIFIHFNQEEEENPILETNFRLLRPKGGSEGGREIPVTKFGNQFWKFPKRGEIWTPISTIISKQEDENPILETNF